MSLQRIKTVLLHTWYHFTHSMETWVDVFWNTALTMIVFVFLASSFKGGENQNQATFMILGMIYWNIIWIGQYGLAIGPLWEIWSRSFSSLFITPLTLDEFLVGQMISSIIKSIAAFAMSAAIGYYFFHFSVFSVGWMLPIYYLELLLFGWAIGMMVVSLIFHIGTDVQSLSWSLVFLVQPFGAVFYPVGVLPPILQTIAFSMPSSYVFEAMRQQLTTGTINTPYVLIGGVLSLIYLVAGYTLLRLIYRRAKQSGSFARMES